MNNQRIDIQVTERDGQTLITSYADMAGTLVGDGVYTIDITILPDDFRDDYWPGKYAFDAGARTVALSGIERTAEPEYTESTHDSDDVEELIAIIEGRAE